MTAEELGPYINQDVTIIVPMNRRTTMSTFGYFTIGTHGQTGESCFQFQGQVNFLIFPQDIQSIEISDAFGTVMRLY